MPRRQVGKAFADKYRTGTNWTWLPFGLSLSKAKSPSMFRSFDRLTINTNGLLDYLIS